jgi:hypothetical protein
LTAVALALLFGAAVPQAAEPAPAASPEARL